MTNPNYWVQNRRDTSQNWLSYNPVLRAGEIGVESDTGKAKIGDGVTSWSGLNYWNPAGAASGADAAPLDSPSFTGVPTAPTPAEGTNTTQLATTAFVLSEIASGGASGGVTSVNGQTGVVTLTAADVSADPSGSASTAQSNAETYAQNQAATAQSNAESYAEGLVSTETSRAEAAEATKAPLASPAFTGTPTAPTATTGTSNTQLATTAFVANTVTAIGAGSVSNVSVTSANGFTGTVATPTTTPAITIETTVNGVLKGNGTAIEAATAGTDYLAPTGSGAGLTGMTVSQISGAAPLASPALTGTPTAPTASSTTNNTQIATTAFVQTAANNATTAAEGYTETALAAYAPLASPALTGTPTAPTATVGTSNTQIATTAFVAESVSSAGGGSVTTVSVVDANGFTGTVANPTSSPAITLETTVNGMVKGNGTALEAATAGTDYLTPTGSGANLTGITVSQVSGAAPLASPALTGTPTAPTASAGTSSTQIATTAFVANAVSGSGSGFANPMTTEGDLIVGGASGAATRLAAGTSGYYLKTNGAGSLPTWAAVASGSGFSLGTVVAPSGDTTGATDVAAINAALADTIPVCWLQEGQYYINAPITGTADGVALIGVNGGWASVSDSYGTGNDNNATGYPTGTIITTVGTFVGESGILFDNESNSSLQVGPYLANFYLDCSAMQVQTATWSVSGEAYSGNGISVYGAVVAGFADHVVVSKAQGSCWVFDSGASGSSTGYPDNWVLRSCKGSSARANEFAGTGNYPGYGLAIWRCPDIVISDSEFSENNTDGVYMNDIANAMFSNTKSENNGSNGWHITGDYGAGYLANWVGCTTNYNNEHGWLFDNTNAGGGPSVWNLTGCKATADGQAGSGYAGFAIVGSVDEILMTGCFVSGATQSYGVYFSGACYGARITGGDFNNAGGSQTFTPLYIASGATVTNMPGLPQNQSWLGSTTLAASGTITPSSAYMEVNSASAITGVTISAGKFNGEPLTLSNTGSYSITISASGSYVLEPSGTPGSVQTFYYSTTTSSWNGPYQGSSGSTFGGGTLTEYIAPKVTALTYATSIAVNAALGNVFTVTLTGAAAFAVPTNPVAGQTLTFVIASGGNTPTWATGTGGYSFGSSTAPSMSTSATYIVGFIYSSAKSEWLYMGTQGGF